MAFKTIKLSPDILLLDPNNPRFSKSHSDETRSDLFSDPEIQEDTLRIMVENEDVHEIESSILKAGFLDMDPILVKKIDGDDLYIVLEGNRRISAVKSLLKKHKEGRSAKDLLNVNILATLKEINCRDLTSVSDEDVDFFLGLRHGGGIKQWPALPTSYNLFKMYMRKFCAENKCDPNPVNFKYDQKITSDIAAAFSITPAEAKKRLMTYRVYTDLVEKKPHLKESLEKKFSIIQEMISKPQIKDELNLDSSERFIFSLDGCDRFFDLVFGVDGNKPLIGGAAVGSEDGGSSVRAYAKLLSKAPSGKLREDYVNTRFYTNRENPEELLAQISEMERRKTLSEVLKLAEDALKRVSQEDLLDSERFGESDREILDRIKKIINNIDSSLSV